MARCKHKWRWLPQTEYALSADGRTFTATNVHCVRCGVNGWGHGRGPQRPPARLDTKGHPK